MSPFDFVLFGVAVLGAAFYGYLEGRAEGFRRGVRAAKREQEGDK